MQNGTGIFLCKCVAGSVSQAKTVELADKLQNLDVDVFELRDLCALTVHEKDVLEELGLQYDQKVIVACYPRAIKNMFRQAGVKFGDFEVLNLKVQSASDIFEKLKKEYQLAEGQARYQVQISELNVPAWFPVIDESRCTLCGQCARFCLFGVYSYNKKSLQVINPLACKNNCPACGRTCPSQAIIFPRLAENTVLAGDEPGKNKIATASKSGSLLLTLNERNLARKNIFRQGVVQLAEDERKKALEEFKKGLKKEE